MIRARPICGALATLDARERKIPVISNFIDLLSEEHSLPPDSSVELTIKLTPRETPNSRTPYHMSLVELEETV